MILKLETPLNNNVIIAVVNPTAALRNTECFNGLSKCQALEKAATAHQAADNITIASASEGAYACNNRASCLLVEEIFIHVIFLLQGLLPWCSLVSLRTLIYYHVVFKKSIIFEKKVSQMTLFCAIMCPEGVIT